MRPPLPKYTSYLFPLCGVGVVFYISFLSMEETVPTNYQGLGEQSQWIGRLHMLMGSERYTDLLPVNSSFSNVSTRHYMWRPPQPKERCKPYHRVVYIKTHKTGSTTMASILERYGYLRDLNIALPKYSHVLSNTAHFSMSMVMKFPGRKQQDFDMIVNHVRYNRKEMDVAVPGAKYITIIRYPVEQLESVFGYFEMAQHWKINTSNPFQTFLSNPKTYFARKVHAWRWTRNCLLFDLGLDHTHDENVTKIKEKIEELSREIDLVMINEYYDESLILLRKLMCWEYEDILYISNTVRSTTHKYKVSEETAETIRSWSAGDMMLYDHFNRTFWEKVREYGPSFYQDLTHFRTLEKRVRDDCTADDRKDTSDRRESNFVLKTNSTTRCADILRNDVHYVHLLRKTMLKRFNTTN